MENVRAVVYMITIIGNACQMAPALTSGQAYDEVALGGSYTLVETVLMHDMGKSPVGFRITGAVNTQKIHDRLYLVQLDSPKLYIMSRKAPKPDGFISHSSKLDTAFNNWFIVDLNEGKIKSIYTDPMEDLFLVNIKRGIGGLFQFQTDDSKQVETDSSGMCNATYTRTKNVIVKVKTGCQHEPPVSTIKENMWSGKLKSVRETLITLSDDGEKLEEIVSKESHVLRSNTAEFAVTKVTSEIVLKRKGEFEATEKFFTKDVETVLKEFGNSQGVTFKESTLIPEKEALNCNNEVCPNFSTFVKENKKLLKSNNIGTSKAALAMIRSTRFIKDAQAEDIYRIINAKENKDILPQLMDILGAVQTDATHQAALKKLKINTDFNLDLCERYLWALSMSPEPRKAIIQDMMQMLSSPHKDDKLWQTIVLSLAAMTKNYLRLTEQQGTPDYQLVEESLKLIEENLKGCKDDDENCALLYIKALANIASPSSLPTLLKHAIGPSQKLSKEAIFAISKLGAKNWNKEVLQAAERIFLSNEYDSSAKTISLDIILETKPSETLLSKLFSVFSHKETSKEVKEYFLQRLNQMSLGDGGFEERVKRVLVKEGLNNYHTLAQGGLSTAFTRDFMPGGSLSTAQEMSNGILKRGNVHFNLDYANTTHTLFTLGLFARGLGSVVGGGEGEGGGEGSQEEEEATAGLQLTVLGVTLRPFVFFTGQGELMSHVFSGKGSTNTPAYQALLLLGKETTSVSLGSGFWVELTLLAGASVDLSGQIEISLWYRNAESHVQKSAGLFVEGLIQVDSSLVKTYVEFNLMAEPKLDLSSNIEFSDNFLLCSQLTQPDSSVKYKTYKVERIPGSRHRLRKTRFRTIPVPGKSYALNAKNNEMCNIIFSDSRD